MLVMYLPLQIAESFGGSKFSSTLQLLRMQCWKRAFGWGSSFVVELGKRELGFAHLRDQSLTVPSHIPFFVLLDATYGLLRHLKQIDAVFA